MKLRYGIIGTGVIGFSKHLQGYSKTDGVQIAAACDIDIEKAKKAAEEFGASFITDDYKELLARDDIDFVSVCLPNYLHSKVTVEALHFGKHVHCEKPMAMNAEEAKDMLDAKTATGKKLMIGLNNRFTPYASFVRELIKGGKLGDIYHINCGWKRRNGLPASDWFADRSKSGGGPFIDLGVHFVDLSMSFLGYPKAETVSACTYSNFGTSKNRIVDGMPIERERVYDVEDIAIGVIRLENNSSINFEISWASNIAQEQQFYEILGTKAGLRFDAGPGFKESERLKYFTNESRQDFDGVFRINGNLYKTTEFSYFADCMKNDTEPLLALPEEGVKMMEIVDAVYKSARTRHEVVL